MFFFAFKNERIIDPIGPANHLQYIAGGELDKYIHDNPFCVIFYGSKNQRFDYANFAISHFRSSVSFARAPMSDATKYFSEPPRSTIIRFKHGNPIKSEIPSKAIEFANWVNELTLPSTILVKHPEEVRKLFSTPGTHVFGVDYATRPSWLLEDTLFYSIPEAYIRQFDINVSNGLYIFRSADRNLIRLNPNQNQKAYMTTSIVDYNDPATKPKKLFGGYFVRPHNTSQNQLESEILKRLAKTHKNVTLGLFHDVTVFDLIQRYNLVQYPVPLFVIFDGTGRWVDFTDPHNETKLDALLSSIEEGAQPYTIVSEPDPIRVASNLLHKTTRNLFQQDVIDGKGDRIVAYLSEEAFSSKKLVLLLNETKAIIEAPELTIYLLNMGLNDLPPNVRIVDGYPQLELYKDGQTTPVIFDNTFQINTIVDFIAAEATHHVTVKPYNAQDVAKRVNKILIPPDMFMDKTNKNATQEQAEPAERQPKKVKKVEAESPEL